MNMEKVIDASDFGAFEHVDLNKQYGNYMLYTIKGNVPEGVSISADGKVTLNGPLSNHTKIEATGKITLKADVGNHVILRGKSIVGEKVTVGAHSRVEAFDGNIDLQNQDIGRDAHLRASGSIEFFTTGRNLDAVAGGDVHFSEIGEKAYVQAAAVYGGSVGNDGDITATRGRVRLSHAGDRSRIFSAEPAQIVNQGRNVTLNDYFEEAPKLNTPPKNAVATKDMVVFNRIIYDDENKCFLIPRALAEHINPTAFIDAARDKGCTIKDTPTSDTIWAAQIMLPPHVDEDVLKEFYAVANRVNNGTLETIAR